MTICLFIKNFEIGGAQKHAIQVANYLVGKGVDVKLISRTDDGFMKSFVHDGVVIVREELPETNNPLKLVGLRYRLLNIIPKGAIVFPNIPNEFRQISRLNLIYRDWRIVYIMHMDLKIKPSFLSWFKALEVSFLINQKYSSVVALTHLQRERHRLKYRAPKIKVIPNFIDLDHNHIKANPGTGLRGVSVGRYVLQKGYDLLLEAMPHVDKDVTIDVFGSGEKTRDKLTKRALDMGVGNIAFNPGISNVLEILSEYDFFILPSRHEPFGLSLIEALSCGLPAVATDCDGPSEIIREGVNGILVKKENPESLANGINRLAKAISKGAYEKNSVRHSIMHLDIDKIIPHYLEDFYVLPKA